MAIKHITLVVGARPNFMKMAPIVRAIEAAEGMSYALIHTGQHYDEKLSKQFFEELEIPAPQVNLEVGSGSQAKQTADIMMAVEEYLLTHPTDLLLVVGDVNSTMAASLAAKKIHIPVAHVEAGIRSGDRSMPEEINRMVTDSIADYFFTTTPEAGQQLEKEGIDPKAIFFVGNCMIDTLRYLQPKFSTSGFYQSLGLEKGKFLVLTLHRPSNVDKPEHLQALIDAVGDGSHGLPVVFPVHPRTQKALDAGIKIPDNFLLRGPEGYLNFMNLIAHSKGVITDSGGVQEETTVLGIPCLTLRANTERPETITQGTNVLVGTQVAALQKALVELFEEDGKQGKIPELWDGKTAQRIVTCLRQL